MLCRKSLILTVFLLFIVAAPIATTNSDLSAAVQKTNRTESTAIKNPFVIFEDGPSFMTRNYSDQTLSEMKTEIVTVPFCGSDLSKADAVFYKEQVRLVHERFANDKNKKTASPNALAGFNIVFNYGGEVPAEAITAMEVVATYLEGLFTDPITVTLSINFAALGPGILGSTSVYYTASTPSWATTRTALVNGMDGDDYIQTFIPAGSLPVRYDGGSSTVTNENRCFFSIANYGAATGSISGTCAAITFSTNFPWDYNPANGISGGTYCFESVAIHEVGHALGFVSRAEDWYQPNTDITSLDIYRFQRTDGTGDYNPDNVSEFQTTARLVDYNNPNDDHNSNLFTIGGTDVEHRMSDGDPDQASHFREGIFPAAIMDPAMGSGQTYYPNFYRAPDIDLFDAIGWDYVVDVDLDDDGIVNDIDNCPSVPNANQLDTDQDSVGDVCDNCPEVANTSQANVDGDSYGDACDPDIDNDGIENASDNCKYVVNVSQTNSDADSLGDDCDNCPLLDNPDQWDEDENGVGDWCDGNVHIHPGPTLPTGYRTLNYNLQLISAGGTAPFTWSHVSGDLPYGLTFNGGTAGTITGVPNYNQTWLFTIALSDASEPPKVDTAAMTLTIIEPPYICGDANGDKSVNISDAVALIAYIFSGGPAPNPMIAGDANCDTAVNISDAVYLIAFIFAGGTPPCPTC